MKRCYKKFVFLILYYCTLFEIKNIKFTTKFAPIFPPKYLKHFYCGRKRIYDRSSTCYNTYGPEALAPSKLNHLLRSNFSQRPEKN